MISINELNILLDKYSCIQLILVSHKDYDINPELLISIHLFIFCESENISRLKLCFMFVVFKV